MRQRSFDFHKPNFRLLLFIVGYLGILLISIEGLLHNPRVISLLPPPSPSLGYAFPEVGVKFKRYFQLGRVNCLIFGSSMADAGIDPEILQKKLTNSNKQPITCMNFGISNSMAETSNQFAQTLVNWQQTELVVLDVSPIDFDKGWEFPRQMTKIPAFQYYKKFEFEGWLLNTFRFPWFYNGLFNQKDEKFRMVEEEYDNLLTSNGIRVTGKTFKTTNPEGGIWLKDYQINPVDVEALDDLIESLQSKGIKIIVVEMPVMPSFYPILMEGGGKAYESKFLEPVQKILLQHGLELIRTQPVIGDLMSDDGWLNEYHMNYPGAKIFTNYLADQILQRGDW
jgi:hypothetical protein